MLTKPCIASFVVMTALLILAPPVYTEYTEYSITAACNKACKEGEETNITLLLFYDVPAMNDQQYALYNNTNPLRQLYTSKISVTRIVLREKLSNATLADQPASIIFADRRIKKNQGLNEQPAAVTISVTLPPPTQLNTSFLFPCFTVIYEREVREYDFLAGDYDRKYVTDTVEQCESRVESMAITPRFPGKCRTDACLQEQDRSEKTIKAISWREKAMLLILLSFLF